MHYTSNGSYATQLLDQNGNAGDNPTSAADGVAVQFKNGVRAFQANANTAAGLTDTLNIGNLTVAGSSTAESNLTYGTATVASTAQVATSIKASASTSGISANASTLGTSTITAEVMDQTGNPMINGQAYALNFHISGAATYQDGTTADKSSAFVAYSTPTKASETIEAQQGVIGATTVTVSGAGLTSGTATVNSVTTQAASKLALADTTDASPAFTESASGVATLTLSAQDANSNTVGLPLDRDGHSYTVYVTNSQGG